MASKTTFARRLSRGISTTLTLALFAGLAASAQTKFRTIHNFTGPNGSYPAKDMIVDAAGNLYGTANQGALGSGMVFRLSPTAGGKWTSTLLHRFHETFGGTNGAGGGYPSSNLVFDKNGNLYGLASSGGGTGCDGAGCGIVYELSPNPAGVWKETVLYAFQGGADGGYPAGKLVMDAAGNLYGTTPQYGSSGFGVAFELSPTSGGWVQTVLHAFTGGSDGEVPYSGLTFDGAGKLYGTTQSGGALGKGTVFQLSPGTGGTWSNAVLYSFAGGTADGSAPLSSVVFDTAGNLYGTTYGGGGKSAGGYGTVFELTPGTGGTWSETVLRTFYSSSDGSTGPGGGYPYSSVVLDAAGNVYGTTSLGGSTPPGAGVVFKLSRKASGGWTESVLHSFANGADGSVPFSGLTWDAAGNLYGTASSGGAGTAGVVFEIKP